MPILRIYKDAALTDRVSQLQYYNNPDYAIIPSDSTTQDEQLWIAAEQTTLDGSIGAADTFIAINDSTIDGMFGEVVVAQVDSEKILITAVNGKTLTVVRGFLDTTAVTHSTGSLLYAVYDATNLTVGPYDLTPAVPGDAQETWYKFAETQAGLDTTAVPGADLALGNLTAPASETFWRRVTVPVDPNSVVYTNISIRTRAAMTVDV